LTLKPHDPSGDPEPRTDFPTPMSRPLQIELVPAGKHLHLDEGLSLQDLLFASGVEFPCGGRGLCKGCKIKVLSGSLPITAEDRNRLSSPELAAGWRLACRAQARTDLKIELGQWESPVLADDSRFEFTPQEGLGVAVDIGTTTVVAQLLDLQTARVLAVRTALNDQARHGADIMSRVGFAVSDAGQPQLMSLIRKQIGAMIGELLSSALRLEGGGLQNQGLRKVVLVGNTVMHHLFSGIDVEPLSHFPFEPATPGLQTFAASSLGWDLPGDPPVHFLPCIGGFVGSDILAGVLATKLHRSPKLKALIDLGTNGEIVIGNQDKMLCASTAAGPAFEGARISMGMRAATGAISEVHIASGKLQCHVLGQVEPRGICGSGLVDAVAASLDLGWIRPNGRLATGESLSLSPPVFLTQWDVRELQLAKGAIAAGCRTLLQQWGATKDDLTEVYLAGAFGNYINHASARRIGLLAFAPELLVPAGNTALLGAKLALFQTLDGPASELLALSQQLKHFSLHEDPLFQETYAEHMGFPAAIAAREA
jgi:uncharacterized 2Fe-2S/4Fe-4S cluster protein (DUF4445 family)